MRVFNSELIGGRPGPRRLTHRRLLPLVLSLPRRLEPRRAGWL